MHSVEHKGIFTIQLRIMKYFDSFRNLNPTSHFDSIRMSSDKIRGWTKKLQNSLIKILRPIYLTLI